MKKKKKKRKRDGLRSPAASFVMASVIVFAMSFSQVCSFSKASYYCRYQIHHHHNHHVFLAKSNYNNNHHHHHHHDTNQQQFQNLKSIMHPNTVRSLSRTNTKASTITYCSSSSTALFQRYDDFSWEGDDIRWKSKALRNWKRRINFQSKNKNTTAARNTLVALNLVTFFYQVLTSISWIRQKHPNYWPSQALSILWDVVWGSARPGPFTLDFVHSNVWSVQQPHRFLTAGFLHGGILHLVLNLNALINLPHWLETGLGKSIYVTTFLTSIVGGNLCHTLTTSTTAGTMSLNHLCLGASGGICGLYGLMYVCLVRMDNKTAASRVLKGMVVLFVYGLVFANISNAGHLGGFLTGILLGILCGPSYEKSYSLRRKNSLEVDLAPRDYRTVMGFDKKPTARGWIPIPVVWSFVAIFLLLMGMQQPQYKAMPALFLRGILEPGTVSAKLFRR